MMKDVQKTDLIIFLAQDEKYLQSSTHPHNNTRKVTERLHLSFCRVIP